MLERICLNVYKWDSLTLQLYKHIGKQFVSWKFKYAHTTIWCTHSITIYPKEKRHMSIQIFVNDLYLQYPTTSNNPNLHQHVNGYINSSIYIWWKNTQQGKRNDPLLCLTIKFNPKNITLREKSKKKKKQCRMYES